MKQKPGIFIIFSIALIFASGAGILFSAEAKRDVADPVLNEIIQNFGLRMPRFIEKYGKDVFVTDEPVTRGNLMLAIYEYDKSLKIPRKEFVSRQEFDELNSRFKAIQAGQNAKKRNSYETENVPSDTTQLINDLIPNMPAMLDSSLNNSKVFIGLKDEIANLRAEDLASSEGQLKISIEQTRNELRELTKKVDSIDKAYVQEDREEPADLTRNLSLTRRQLAKLEKRVDNLEKSKEPTEVSKSSSSGQDSKSGTSVISKLSMGLSMVAALFIAR